MAMISHPDLLLALLFWGCGGPDSGGGPDSAGVLVRVGEAAITQGHFEKLEMNLPDDLKPQGSGVEAIRELLGSLVDREIMVLEAEALGFSDDPGVQRRLTQKRVERLKKMVLSRAVGESQVPDEEVETAYRTQGWSRRVRPAHILTKTEEEAWEIVRAVKAGADFAELAKERSTAPDGQRGGDVGQFFGMEAGQSELVRTALSLAPGEVSVPIRSRHGYEVIQTVEVDEVALEDVRHAIVSSLSKQKSAAEHETLLRELEEEFEVAYDSDGVEAMLAAIRDTSATPVTQIDLPLVRYGGTRELTVGAASRSLLRKRLPLQALGDSAAVSTAVRTRLLADSLLVMKARKGGWHESEEFLSYIETERRKLLVNHLRRREVLEKVEVSQDELQEEYERDPDELQVPVMVGVTVITAKERGEAEMLLSSIRGGADMVELARQQSTRPGGARSGDHLHISEGESEKWGPLYDTAWRAEVGSLVGPVEVKGGFSILRIEERMDARARTLDEMTPILRHRITQRRNLEAFEEFIVRLRSEYDNRIRWNDESISELAARRADRE